MSSLLFSAPATRRPPTTAVIATLTSLCAGAVQAWRHRRADRSMQLLSDAMLHDIGVARSEIETVTRHGRPDRR